ncbi:hypothetical protein BO79DRAFT_267645 [Aspergillus costaricaensis CBS 115574]|uniref:Uncharacterized protein n=1 Tax=Aspergillus costaricaensis CBS 115574 TaxID=1448317 RepID=A0ACD1IT18_9EURO|nr:hypothetical protein BO79DRAFT_267645 [Aspergillus costaricaensis CBS 115574]RAK93485.1 hypothetical protein BO79DRAFT_267645 [Aspergillus costaricaensis CBS 115574]
MFSNTVDKHPGNPIPTNLHQRMGDPGPLGMCGFATTLLTLSLAMMRFRGVSVQDVFIGNFCFVGCIALLISAQWELVRGNTFSYTVLSAFGLFYGGYGAILLPSLGIAEAYGGKTSEYYNAMGFFILIWTVCNTFFVIASLAINVVYFAIFVAIEICFGLTAAANFIQADGDEELSLKVMQVAGAFGFVAGCLGFYAVAHGLCQETMRVRVPMGDTSTFFKKL